MAVKVPNSKNIAVRQQSAEAINVRLARCAVANSNNFARASGEVWTHIGVQVENGLSWAKSPDCGTPKKIRERAVPSKEQPLPENRARLLKEAFRTPSDSLD